jgi:hypothetical protein
MLKAEKRSHKRFPVLKDMAEPVDLFVMDGGGREVPAGRKPRLGNSIPPEK